jgi:CTP:molybdopterin cytidylyltransferase MocA
VAVVLGARADEIWPVLTGFDVDRIDNPDWNEGLSSSIRAAVAWARRRSFDALLVSVADQRELQSSHLDRLIVRSLGGNQLVASRYAGVVAVPAIFPAGYFASLEALRGDVGARELLRSQQAAVAAVDWPAGAFDVDRRIHLTKG